MRLHSVRQVVRGLKDPTRSLVQVRCVQDNLGDIMVAEAIDELLTGISVMSGEPSRKCRVLDATLGIRRVFGYACLGGGTLIFAPRGIGWLESLQYFVQRTMPLCTFGSGVIDPAFRRHVSQLNGGFVVSDRTAAEWIDCLRRFEFVSVRGVESQRILQEYGLETAEVIGDPALYYSRTVVEPKKHVEKLGVNLSSCLEFWNNGQAAVVCELTRVIRHFSGTGWRVTLFPTEPRDHELAHEVVAASDHGVLICDVHDRPESFIKEVGQQDLFIGTKLHSVISAFCAYTPALMVGYQPKCLDFMRTLGFEHHFIRSDRLQAEQIIALLQQMYSHTEQIQAAQYQACQLYRNRILGFRDRVLDHIGAHP